MSRKFRLSFEAALAAGVALIVFCPSAPAKTISPRTQSPEQVLHEFVGAPDGETPASNLLTDPSGNFYGTTDYGGDPDCKLQRKGPKGCGTLYKMTSGGSVTILHAFGSTAMDGLRPTGNLAADSSGNLYGLTSAGGANGFGTIFEVVPDGTESVLYSFSNSISGPSGLLRDSEGNLYGVAYSGGGTGCAGQGCGTVFQFAPDGTFTVLYSFGGGSDGANPGGALAMDASGNIYGTTSYGGTAGDGTVFELTPGGTETVLYSFQGSGDGTNPVAGVIIDALGNLYGTTSETNFNCSADSCGVVFELAPDGTETVLHAFQGNPDGVAPAGSLAMDASGNIYGTTIGGGAANNGGTLFKLAPGGTETVLYSFGSKKKYGSEPAKGVVLDSSGNVYGTTNTGGHGGGGGFGVVFKVTQ